MNATTTPRRHPERALAAVLVAMSILTALMLAPSAWARPHAHPHRQVNFAPHAHANIFVTKGDFLGRQLATWYGPGFFGHRTACGQTLRPNTWGIAHRTLPCGTLVTLTRGGRTVSVRVIDRGPFSGASIDLTARTRNYLRFVDGSVSMTVVNEFKLSKK